MRRRLSTPAVRLLKRTEYDKAMAAYDDKFYGDLDETAAPSARRIAPMVMALTKVESVIDIGCGDASWLSVFAELGVPKIQGVDGHWIEDSAIKIPLEYFQRRHLDQDLNIDGQFDVAMSVEVAEHLPVDAAPAFVTALCRLAPVVLFSAAIPHQGGLHHYNEQWPGYWAALFAGHGYRAIDVLRDEIWDDPNVTWWYKQNLVLYASDEALAANELLAAARARSLEPPRTLVHPEKYLQAVKQANPSFGRSLRLVGASLKRALSKSRR